MTVAVILVFVPALLSGMLLVHLLWPDRGFWSLAVKAFLGIGVGLGLQSVLCFLYLLLFPALGAFIYLDLATLACLLILALILERRRGRQGWSLARPPGLNGVQRVLVLVGGIIFVV